MLPATDGGPTRTETDDDVKLCPECGSDDVKRGAAANPDDVADFGCRECGTRFDEPVAVDTLRYEKRRPTTHEVTGKTHDRITTHEHDGEVFKEEGGLIGFRRPDVAGVYFVLHDGTVEFDPHTATVGAYEVGENATVERGHE